MLPNQLQPPPADMIMPAANNFYSIASLLSLAAFAAWTIYLCYKAKSPVLLLILIGGTLCYLQEPIMDRAGAVWYPAINQVPTVLRAFNESIPLWVIPGYGLFVGAVSVVLYRMLCAGMTAKALWIFNFVVWGLDMMLELPGLNLGTYIYFGHPALMFFGFPVTWAASNTCIVMLSAGAIFGLKDYLTGWRMLLIPVIVTMANGAAQGATEWPVFLALNSNSGYPVKLLAALVTIGLSLIIVQLIALKLTVVKPVTRVVPQTVKEHGHVAHLG